MFASGFDAAGRYASLVMASIITPYERHLVFSYLHNLVARVGDSRLNQATDRECLPEWIREHADLLQCGAPLSPPTTAPDPPVKRSSHRRLLP